MPPPRTVTVFGSARPAPGTPDYVIAYEIGAALAGAGYAICNGGYAGTMEASARGAKDAGGCTIGIVTDEYPLRKANLWIDTVITTGTMLERLHRLVTQGDACVVLRGGTGTLLELAMAWELINKGLLAPRPIVLAGDFWRDVVRTVRIELAGGGREGALRHVTVVHTPEECVQAISRGLASHDAAQPAGELPHHPRPGRRMHEG